MLRCCDMTPAYKLSSAYYYYYYYYAFGRHNRDTQRHVEAADV